MSKFRAGDVVRIRANWRNYTGTINRERVKVLGQEPLVILSVEGSFASVARLDDPGTQPLYNPELKSYHWGFGWFEKLEFLTIARGAMKEHAKI